MFRLWKALLSTVDGLGWGMRHETALRQELALVIVAVPVSFFVATSTAWWLALICSLLLLIVVELLNTAVEKLADHVTPKRDPAIKVVKDLGSAAVFMTLVLAGAIWLAALAARFF